MKWLYVDDRSHGEIAERMQKPLGIAKAWTKHRMGSLRKCMA